MKDLFLENLIKNTVLLVVLFPFYFEIQKFLNNSGIGGDKGVVGNLLIAVSILVVTACFGCFAFTYEKTNHKNHSDRLLAHLITGLLMLLIGISLEMTAVLTKFLINDFWIFSFCLLLLYLAIVLYDFWDLKRSDL